MQSKYCFLAVVFILGLAGCDYLDTRVDIGNTQENLDSNYASLFRLGYTPYGYLRHGFNVIDNNIMAAVSDEAEQTSAQSAAQLFNNGSWNRYRNPLDVYANHYKGIRTALFFLDYSADYREKLAFNRDTISGGSEYYWLDVEDARWMRAEANILLAWFYFDLIKRYGDVPFVNRVLAETDNANLPRTSTHVIVDSIVARIDSNVAALQPNWKSRDNSKEGRLTTGAALALKSRILLYAASPLNNPDNDLQKWQQAAKAANDLIQLKASVWDKDAGTMITTNDPAYTLSDSYRQLFLESNSVNDGEIIWAIRLGPASGMEEANYPIGTPGGNSGVTPSHNLVAAYEHTAQADASHPYANRDPRLRFSIVTNNDTWNGRTIETWLGGRDSWSHPNTSRTGYYLKKFMLDNLDIQHGETRNRNWIVFRYAEILLNYAEAMNEAYGPDDPQNYALTARQAVNMIRGRADVKMPPVDVALGDQPAMKAAIKHERRIELAFEEHRYWDLIRWKDGAELNKPIVGIRAAKTGEGTYSYTETNVENRVFVAPKMYYFPIPDAEIVKSNGVLTQNPEW
jgi:hypothetical protein